LWQNIQKTRFNTRNSSDSEDFGTIFAHTQHRAQKRNISFHFGWGCLHFARKRPDFDTKTPVKLSFSGDQRGKTIYFALRWENNVGEKCPCSEIFNAIIP
jgi:hypothetical protein